MKLTFTASNIPGSPGTKRSWRGGKGRGEHKCMGPDGGRVGVFRLEGTQERRRPGDLTGGRRGEGGLVHVGKD